MLNFRVLASAKPIIFAFILTGCFVAGFFENFYAIAPVEPQTAHVLTCNAPLSSNKDVFKVYLTEVSVANMAITELCENTVIKRQFGNVSITIGQNDYDTYRYINHGVSDLALVNSNVVDAFNADRIYGYETIAAHPDYSAYFIALKEKPVLTKEYLLGKRIGILDYPSSRSGHIVPKTVLQGLGLNETNVKLQYYNSHQELRRALLAGEVDIISSYWGKGDEEMLSRNYITPLEKQVSGMRWYLKMETRNTDLRCAMQAVIVDIAKQHPRAYYQTVDIIGGCPNG